MNCVHLIQKAIHFLYNLSAYQLVDSKAGSRLYG